MRGAFDEVEPEPLKSTRDTELTLGSGALLSLVAGLFLLCAVCFGLGYAVGHRGAASASAAALPAPAQPIESNNTLAKPSATAQTEQAPSADANDPAQPNQTFTASGAGGFGELPGYLNGVGGVNDHGGTILQFQDNQAQTNFWSQFIAEANQLNNTFGNIANGTVQPTASEVQSLITQINNYNEFGASFSGSQGGVFGDRFDNELLSGTLKTDTANAVSALQSVEANGLNATNAAQLVAAGVGFVADANDVSGNNLPTGGGSFVGTATTVAGATTTGAATVGTTVPVSGAVDGNDNPTANPVDGLANNGFGVSNPDPNATQTAGGTGSAGTGSTDSGTGSGATSTSGLSSAIAGDIASLVQALEGGHSSAISAAVATLTAAISGNSGSAAGGNCAGGSSGAGGSQGSNGSSPPIGDTGGNEFSDHGFGHHHQFEHMWH